jgi:hypothetical protein
MQSADAATPTWQSSMARSARANQSLLLIGAPAEALAADEDDISKFAAELRDWDDGGHVRALLARRFVNATTDGMTKTALAAADGLGTLGLVPSAVADPLGLRRGVTSITSI